MAKVTNEELHIVDADDVEIETSVAEWIQQQADAEIKRLTAEGQKIIPLKLKNSGFVYDGKSIVNRAEINTTFDFGIQSVLGKLGNIFLDRVTQIMVSDSIPCPVKPGFLFVKVILQTEKGIPLLLPYLYQKVKTNKLNHWLFVNNDQKRSRHRVDF